MENCKHSSKFARGAGRTTSGRAASVQIGFSGRDLRQANRLMRVALDTNGLYTTQAGVARYLRGLINGLGMLPAGDVEFFELAWPVTNFDYHQPQRMARTAYRELVWWRWIAPRLVAKEQVDLIHTNSQVTFAPRERLPEVYTLHDLAVIRYPERFRRWHRLAAQRSLRDLPSKDKIICVSQFTADEALRLTGVNAARLEVVYNGCDFDDASPEQRPDGWDIPSEFFLFVGSIEPGKNLSLLKLVYELALQRGVVLPPLVIVGARWHGVAGEGMPPSNWHYLGRQPDEVLVYLYRRTLALVFPTKYEGFGLPLVEAMSLGCPVICSRVASLPEVGGEAPLYAELTPDAYLEALRALAGNMERRSSLAAAGRMQAQRFSWKGCAEQTVEAYRTVLA